MAKKDVVKTEVSGFMKAMMDSTKDVFGDRNFMASESEKFAIGIPFEHLSLMYLFGMNILPLSKSVGIAGPPASCKSALGFTLIKMVCEYHGVGSLVEAEGGKVSPQLLESILGYELVHSPRVGITQAVSIDEAQTALTRMTKAAIDYDPGKSIPVAFLLDSLTGSDMEEVNTKTNTEGHAGRNHPAAALSWNSYFKFLQGRLACTPMGFFFVNHRKEKPPAPGQGHLPPKKTTPGGLSQWFHASTYLWTDLVRSDTAASRQIEGGTVEDCPIEYRTIRLFTQKNSLAVGERPLLVDFIWYYDEEGKQHSYFDWDSATAVLLAHWQDSANQNSTALDRKALRAICDVSVEKKKYSSKRLGLEDVNGITLGAAVRKDKELMTELMDHFHISHYPVLQRPDLNEKGEPLPRPAKKGGGFPVVEREEEAPKAPKAPKMPEVAAVKDEPTL